MWLRFNAVPTWRPCDQAVHLKVNAKPWADSADCLRPTGHRVSSLRTLRHLPPRARRHGLHAIKGWVSCRCQRRRLTVVGAIIPAGRGAAASVGCGFALQLAM